MPTFYAAPVATECTATLPSWSAPAAGSCTATFDSDARWRRARPSGIASVDGYGEPGVRNEQEFVRPAGFFDEITGPAPYPAGGVSAQMPERLPTPAQRITTRGVYLGAPTVYIPAAPTLYAIPDGFDGLAVAKPAIDWLTFLVRAGGVFEDGIAPRAPSANRISARLFGGFESPPITRVTASLPVPGAPKVARYYAPATQHSSTYGEDQSIFGATRLLYDQFVKPGGLHPPPVSSQKVENFTRLLLPSGWHKGGVGVGTRAINKNRRLFPGGSDYMAFHHVSGGPGTEQKLTVWFRNRPVDVDGKGIDQLTIPKPTLTHFLRYLELAGKSKDYLAHGVQWISRSPRHVAPDSRFDFPPTIDSSHMVGGTRYLLALGSDMSRFGTRIVPEGQIINTPHDLNMAGYGMAHVELWIRRVHPDGFETIHTALRFGQHDVWNLRQYIHHQVVVGEPSDRLNPPAITDRHRADNRNRVMAPTGSRMDRFGYTRINNAARAVLPFGAPPPQFVPFQKYGFVTHWIQPAQPAGLEAMVFGRWLSVYNGARVIGPVSVGSQQQFGQAALKNLNRTFTSIGRIESMGVGYPFVADAVRELTFDPRYAIAPPYNSGHVVKLYTRYVFDATVGDSYKGNTAWLQIRWNIVYPRWGIFHPPDYVGMAAMRNVTPELRHRGKLSEEFGQAMVRKERESYETLGDDMMWFGRLIIRDRRTWSIAFGVQPPAVMPGPVLTKFGGRPEDQIISVRKGIEPTPRIQNQVPPPKLNYQFVLAEGFDTSKFVDPLVKANSIRVEPGYWDHLFSDETRVELLHRVLEGEGIERLEENVGDPRLSPHTIYAVMDAPAQAKRNHPSRQLHYVDHSRSTRLTGVGANQTISFRYRTVKPNGFVPPGSQASPRPKVENKTKQVWTEGFMDERVGWPVIPGPQYIDQDRGGWDSQSFAEPLVAPPPYFGPRYVKPAGKNALTVPKHEIDFFHRHRGAQGFDAMLMGKSLHNDTPYLWQGLRVGPRVPIIISGGDQNVYGDAWVSLWERDLAPESFDGANVDGYDPRNFGGRLKVRNAMDPTPARRTLAPVGVAAPFIYGHSTRKMLHHILPDGDSDQFRKSGGFPLPGLYDSGGQDFSELGETAVEHA